MPIILCPEHGRSGCAAVCKHLATDFEGHQPLRRHRLIRLAESETDILAFSVRLCQECLRASAIPSDIQTIPFEAPLEKYPQLAEPRLFCQHLNKTHSHYEPNKNRQESDVEVAGSSGYYALLPLALPFDIVTSPVQVAIFLIEGPGVKEIPVNPKVPPSAHQGCRPVSTPAPKEAMSTSNG